ncbi:hypothetical protein [Ruminiclostridium josui]|uniref:hypothetical protein n=1 Tax=Ruminiclostridium josui TaxID=1499 RepID=UPI000463D28B|nr:hypothetical protein [Ruminiclostridium josui]
MSKTKGAQTISLISGRKIVMSGAIGKTNADEIEWLTDTVLESANAWKRVGWAYIADCSKMVPVGPGEIGALVKMTKAFVDAGCKAFAFVEGSSVLLKIQTKKNTELSKTGVLEWHFAKLEEALEWLQNEVKI